jgi:hypothetical protein
MLLVPTSYDLTKSTNSKLNEVSSPSCPALPKLPQLHHIPDLSEYIYNDTVTFQCDVGFLLSGPALITCTTNNRQSPVYWNGKQPNCTGM